MKNKTVLDIDRLLAEWNIKFPHKAISRKEFAEREGYTEEQFRQWKKDGQKKPKWAGLIASVVRMASECGADINTILYLESDAEKEYELRIGCPNGEYEALFYSFHVVNGVYNLLGTEKLLGDNWRDLEGKMLEAGWIEKLQSNE